jgi:hypothetical protein
MKFNSEKLLEQFGNVFHAGKWCKRFDCLSCEFFYTCPPKFRDRKAKTEKDPTDDYVLRNLTFGWKLDKAEFHLEGKVRG